MGFFKWFNEQFFVWWKGLPMTIAFVAVICLLSSGFFTPMELSIQDKTQMATQRISAREEESVFVDKALAENLFQKKENRQILSELQAHLRKEIAGTQDYIKKLNRERISKLVKLMLDKELPVRK